MRPMSRGIMPALLAGFLLLGLFRPAGAAVWGLTPRLVLLDPGHGGRDSGTTHGGAVEADINLAAARSLARELENLGIRVVLARTTKGGALPENGHFPNRPRKEMEARAHLAAELHPDLYLSLHCNAWTGGGRAFGAQVFVDRKARPSSIVLGKILSKDLRVYTGTERDLSTKIDHYLLKRLGNDTALTLEMGYLTDPSDRRRLSSPAYRQRFVRIVTMSLVRYLTGIRGAQPPSGKMGSI